MEKFDPETIVRKELISFKPYTPGEQPGSEETVVKLNTNENPYPPSPKILARIQEIIGQGLLRKYPNHSSYELQKSIAKRFNLEPNQVLVTNGSDEALRLLFYALVAPGDTVIAPDPTYSLYPVLTEELMLNAIYKRIPLLENLHFDFESLLNQGKLLAFAHPNAPTGILEEKANLIALIDAFPGVVLSDEAYIDFAEPNASLIDQINDHPNLLVARTFSKSYSLAGLRVGFLIGEKKLIQLIGKLKDSYNVGILDQKIAQTAWEDETYFYENIKKIIRERTRLTEELEKLGFTIPKSSANFIFCKPKPGVNPEWIYQTLKDQNILVRYLATGIAKDYIRISVGSELENNQLISAIHALK